ncbi:DUF192 domain-containing protein [Desulforudis sp. 1088]|uniref:DUF192 domain-containing protein n=1 Tax=unclassified Candidatus Desulforudis TaxID=2635950 RepID=UPI003CE4EAFC
MARVINLSRGNAVLVENLEFAITFGKRFLGLMGRRAINPRGGLLLQPCRSVHTFWMRFPIDLVYLDPAFRVVALLENVPPSRMAPGNRHTRSVLELPAGRLRETGTSAGDILRIE